MGVSVVGKILYQPLATAISITAGIAANKAVDVMWERIEPGTDRRPLPGDEDAPIAKVAAGAVLGAATFAVTKVVADRLGRRFFKHITGFWPGDAAPQLTSGDASALDGA